MQSLSVGTYKSRDAFFTRVQAEAIAKAFAWLRDRDGRIDPARLTAFVVCGALGIASLGSLRSHVAAHNAIASDLPALSVPVTVSSGDSLWKLAKRYGNPSHYIQENIDRIASANRISSSQKILPGQRLIVPVENPVEVARLQTRLASR